MAARLEDAGEHRTPPLPSPPVAGHASLRSWMAAAGLSDASSPAQRHLATLWAAAKEAPRLARLHEAVRASELVIAEREAAESERRIAAMAKRAGALEADNARLRDALAAACGREEEARQEAGRAAGRLDSVRRRAEAMAAALEAAGVESGGPGLEARLERAVEGLVALEMRSAGVGELESEAEGEAGELESLGGRLEGALWAAREEVLRLSASLRAAEHAREVAAGQKRALEEELAEAVEEARRRGAEGREAAAALEEARRRLGSLDAAGLAAEQAAAAVEEALRRENEALQREVEEAREGERRREAEVAELEQRWRALGEELECKESR